MFKHFTENFFNSVEVFYEKISDFFQLNSMQTNLKNVVKKYSKTACINLKTKYFSSSTKSLSDTSITPSNNNNNISGDHYRKNLCQYVAYVDINGIEPGQASAMYSILTVKADGNYSAQDISMDVQSLLMTGEFANVGFKVEELAEGLKVVYSVEPYFELKRVKVSGTHFLPTKTVENMFEGQLGLRLNLNRVLGTLAKIEKWYYEQGKGFTFDILSVSENREKGILEIKLVETPLEHFKLTDIYRSMRTDILNMRIMAETEKL
jgi:hypothetical protein